ncbi:MAG: GNAT family N-acetyltransferase [Ktedonobacteraceae bacterium]|nr:GNAT family N-acetyltransferase [Ktedonobacteraceae bacterium]MBO0789517.1 GNAT family N-acetyltransferase [Ktedonobacteraceae bacterium]
MSLTDRPQAAVVRDARIEDSSGIADVLYELGWFKQVQDQPVAQTQVQIARRIARCQREQSHAILVAEMNGKVVGYVAVHWFPNLALGYDGYISELFLHPTTTGKGIGSRLLSEIEERARKQGCSRLLLMNRRNRESYQRGFYAKHGWTEMEDGAFFTRTLF